jgi:hypothetical protein
MEVKENVKKFLEEDETKRLWEMIYDRFKEKGMDGIKEVLEEEAKKIQGEFERIKKNIEKQIGGEA